MLLNPILYSLYFSLLTFGLNRWSDILLVHPKISLLSYTSAQLFAGLVGAIYLVRDRDNLSVSDDKINLNFSVVGLLGILGFAVVVINSTRLDWNFFFFLISFVVVEFYKFQGVNSIFMNFKALLPKIVVLGAILCLLMILSTEVFLVFSVFLGLLFGFIFMDLKDVRFKSFNLFGKDFLYLVPVILGQFSAFYIFLRPGTFLAEKDFVQLRSDLAFISLGGVFSSLSIIVLNRINFKIPRIIVLAGLFFSFLALIFKLPYNYILVLILSGILNGVNRVSLSSRIYVLVSVISPSVVIIFSWFDFTDVKLLVFCSYSLHIVFSLIAQIKWSTQLFFKAC